MRHMSLLGKIGTLVAVLALSGGIIAVVGAQQLANAHDRLAGMVDKTAPALMAAAAIRVELLLAVRAEKNAVLIPDKARATEFAGQARKAMERLAQHHVNLRGMIDASPATREGKALSDFDRAIEEFEENQEEVLRLAIMKSNIAGRHILHDELHVRVHEAEEFFASLGEPASGDPVEVTQAPDGSRQAAKVAAGQGVISKLYDLLYHLSVHLDASTDQAMSSLDMELRQRLLAYQEALRRVSVLLSESERSRGTSVLAALEAVKSQVASIQEFSHANTDIVAVELTSTKTIELADRCDSLIDGLRQALIEDRLRVEKRAADQEYQFGHRIIVATAGIGLLAALGLAGFIIRSITRPVHHGIQVFEALAAGDLTRRINLNQRDEIGRLAAAADRMADSLCGIVSEIRAQAMGLGRSSSELSSVSQDLLAQSHEMATQAETVAAGTQQTSQNVTSMAAAAEQMSVNVASISSASEEVSMNVATIAAGAESASQNVGSVAEAIGQITSSLQQVTRDARQGSQMTQEAREMTIAANQAMRQLDQAAGEITKVTEIIKSIALQTNLLALNATIEATSAGEAGKGFAVVAGEIKELANQSGQSAEEIARKIETVQGKTREAVKIIEDVARFVSELNVSAGRISEVVDLQTRTADRIMGDVVHMRKGVADIARSIAEVAKGANDVSGNTSEAAKAATDVSANASEAAQAAETISSNIHGVSAAARENSISAAKVDETARRLKEISAELERGVAHFNIGGTVAVRSHV